jgi:hypothetical protein
MKKRCAVSGIEFVITPSDLSYYDKVSPVIGGVKYSLPTPSLCPNERQRRRIAFRNERRFYHRKCDLTGHEIVSMYSSDKPYVIYDQKEWWSDRWDATSYGRAFDFTKSFFEQFEELRRVVPRVCLLSRNSVNSDYTNISADNKNCYLIIESSNNQDSYYSYWLQKCSDCIDCSFCYECELCYETSDCRSCYNLKYSQNCRGCSDSAFLESCSDCAHCFGCINLRQKSYHIFNKPYSKEAYLEKMAGLSTSSHASVMQSAKDAHELFSHHPRKYSQIINSENCSGCYIADSANCQSCFHAVEAKDCTYCVHVWRNAKDCMDVDTAGRNAELIYETINCGVDVYHNLFCMTCWTAQELLYCDFCHYSKNCFGCVGLQHKEYCILNRQYTKAEYEALIPRIIEHLRATGEWGEFFPAAMSCFGYNETAAFDSFPLTRSEALARGYKWQDEDSASRYQGRQYRIPDSIEAVADDLTKAILLCEESNRPYRVMAQELSFYRKNLLPIPRRSPEQRHRDRMAKRLPRTLWPRECSQCRVKQYSPYGPERPEKVLCEKCFAELLC